ncbi:MAG: membrane protein insertase YidC [Bacteroidales bacterium]|nr:membrane protein insertase YidC [Bacteroidales bacterium]
MDKNTIIGLILIFLLFILFGILNRPPQETLNKAKNKTDSLYSLQNDTLTRKQILANSSNKAHIIADNENDTTTYLKILKERYGILYKAAIGKVKNYVIENNKLRITFSNKGARPIKVELKEFKNYSGHNVQLLANDSNIFSLNFFTENKLISTENLFFEPLTSDTFINAKDKSAQLIFRLHADSLHYIDFIYNLHPDSYKVNYSINWHNFNEILKTKIDYVTYNIKIYPEQCEKNYDFEKSNTTIYYKYLNDEVEYLSETKNDKQEITNKLKWIAYKQQFFSVVFSAHEYFESAILETKEYPLQNSKILKELSSELILNYSEIKNYTQNFTLYFGINHFNTLKKQGIPELEKIIPLGWGIFGWVNKYFVIPVFNFLDDFIPNYGIIILIMTILVKIILFPLTYKSYLATAKMKILQPQIAELQKKIPKDKPLELQQATMNLYRRAGVNPMGGCLPMLLQLPILFALFRFFPQSFELRHKSFLWADDLSSYDSIITFSVNIPLLGNHISLFCLLMTLSTIAYTYIQNRLNPQSTSMPSMKFLSYLFPIMFLFIFNNYSAGLSYYYLLFNIFSFAQMFLFSKFVDEEKLLKQIEENKKKPRKKSAWQERMEKIIREQQKANAKRRKL